MGLRFRVKTFFAFLVRERRRAFRIKGVCTLWGLVWAPGARPEVGGKGGGGGGGSGGPLQPLKILRYDSKKFSPRENILGS